MNEYERIIEHYGPLNQKNKAIEELNELIIALKNNDIENQKEEIADVMNMCYQLRIIYRINPADTLPGDIDLTEINVERCIEALENLKTLVAKEIKDGCSNPITEAIRWVLQEIICYTNAMQFSWFEITDRMKYKNQRTIGFIDGVELKVSTYQAWKGTDL